MHYIENQNIIAILRNDYLKVSSEIYLKPSIMEGFFDET